MFLIVLFLVHIILVRVFPGVQSALLHICVPGMESNRYFLNVIAVSMSVQS